MTCILQNPQCDIQAQDRCHRIGQTKPVIIYRLVTANTIDQRIVERAAAKRKLEKMVIHKGKERVPKLYLLKCLQVQLNTGSIIDKNKKSL